jgi:hypothetical protein
LVYGLCLLVASWFFLGPGVFQNRSKGIGAIEKKRLGKRKLETIERGKTWGQESRIGDKIQKRGLAPLRPKRDKINLTIREIPNPKE